MTARKASAKTNTGVLRYAQDDDEKRTTTWALREQGHELVSEG
jgi:hypothetical protein